MKTISPQPRTCIEEDTPTRRMIGKIMRRISFGALCRAIIVDVGQTDRFIISLEKT